MKSYSEMTLTIQDHMTKMKLKGATFTAVAKTCGFKYHVTRQVIFDRCKELLERASWQVPEKLNDYWCKELLERAGWQVPEKLNDYYIRIHAIELLSMLDMAKFPGCELVPSKDELTFWKNTAAMWQKKAEEASMVGERVFVRSEDEALKEKVKKLEEELKTTKENRDQEVNDLNIRLGTTIANYELMKTNIQNQLACLRSKIYDLNSEIQNLTAKLFIPTSTPGASKFMRKN